MMQCTKCKEFKLANAFAKDNKKVNGLTSQCKQCRNKYRQEHYYKNHVAEQQRRLVYRINNVEKVKASNRNTKLKKAYGITQEQYIDLSNKQDNKCACCDKKTKLVVDHCHTTGALRELLCHNCNTALGLLNENIYIIQQLENYVRKHNGIIQMRTNR